MRKFDQRYPDARTTSGKSSWPRGVHKISQIGLDNIGVDNEGRLYWNGQMVKEANPLELTHQQEVSAIIAVVSGVVLANRAECRRQSAPGNCARGYRGLRRSPLARTDADAFSKSAQLGTPATRT